MHKYRSHSEPLPMKWVRCGYTAYPTEQIARVSSSNLVVSISNIGVHLSAVTQAYLQLTAGMMEVYVLGGRRHFINNPVSLYCVVWYICLLGCIDIFDLFWIKTSIVCTIITCRNNEYTWQLMGQLTMILTAVWLTKLFRLSLSLQSFKKLLRINATYYACSICSLYYMK